MIAKKMEIVAIALLIGLVLTAGCKKKEQPATTSQSPEMKEMMHKAADSTEEANKAASKAVQEVASMEQTICPISGEKIDKNVFVEYKGKKVYFCCAACKGEFEKDPEKYIAKLPQFAK